MTAPVLDSSASPSFSAILEGATNPGGVTVAALIVDGSITDLDGAVEAIAITGLNTSLGAWQYSLDAGATWLTIRADLINSTSNELALLLGSAAKIRLLPFGELSGALSDGITFRAWDQSSGTQGSYVAIDSTGGDSAFSVNSDTASASVASANDQPTFAPPTGSTPVYTDFNSGSQDFPTSVIVQPDGKVVVVGGTQTGFNSSLAMARYNADGSPDTTFNGTGKVVTAMGVGDVAYRVTLQADGKLLLAGSSYTSGVGRDFAVVRYNTDGSLDTSFNGTGKVLTDIGNDIGDFGDTGIIPVKYIGDFGYGVAAQPDGKIVVGGYASSGAYDSYDFALTRYNSDGSLDATFNGTGKVLTDLGSAGDKAYSMLVLPDGKIVLAGTRGGDFALMRYNADGSADTSLNGTGKLLTNLGSSGDAGYSVAVQPDGKIVLAGATGGDFAVVRYNADGSLDSGFNGTGNVVTDVGSNSFDTAYSVTILADGKIVVVGDSYGTAACVAVVRYNADGSLDTSLNGTGKMVTGTTNGLGANAAIQPDGKILLTSAGYAGSLDFAVARYNADGSVDTTFTPGGTGTLATNFAGSSMDVAYSVTVQADGKILAAGVSDASGSNDFALARYNADGSLDATFDGTGRVSTDFGDGSNDWGQGTAIQADGKILVAGTSGFSTAVARYNTDGSLDATYGEGGRVITDAVDFGRDIALLQDGATAVVGYKLVGGNCDFALARISETGVVESTVFADVSGGFDDVATGVMALSGGNILVLGCSDVAGTYRIGLARYLANGNLDTSFNGTGKLLTDMSNFGNTADQAVGVQADGKMVVAGVAYPGSYADFALARYNVDGSLDTTFGTAGKLTTDISGFSDFATSVTVQADGKILVAGHATGNSDWNFALVRYNADGSLDTTFNGTGKATADIGGQSSDLAYTLCVQADGKIIVAGAANAGAENDFALARFNANGTLDTSFNTGSSTLGRTVSYNSGWAPIALDAAVAIHDTELAALAAGAGNYGGASITLSRNGGASAGDLFSARGNLSFSGGNAVLTGVTVGTVTNSGGLLAITFNGNATQARVNEVLSSIGYANNSDAGTVVINYVFSDGNAGAQGAGGALTATGSTTVQITAHNLTLTGTTSADVLTGAAGNDVLTGLAGNDSLIGFAGNDRLDGGAGTDVMNGGEGSDLYMVSIGNEHSAAEIADSGTGGADEVRFAAAGSGTLTIFAGDTGIERVVIGTGTGASAVTTAITALNVNAAAATNALSVTGNAGVNTLTGTAFSDTLDGGAGADRLVGGNGNDTYVVDNARDVVTESSAAGGTDLVQAFITYTLLANVENLSLMGAAAINGIGNTVANTITGNAAVNLLDGKGGIDSLDGQEGSDVYFIGLVTDHQAAEIADSGTSGADEVRVASAKAGTLTLFAGDTGIERVVIGTGTGAAAITTGTAAVNVNAAAVANALSITGNAGANILTGTAYDDTLIGGKGNDNLTGGAGADRFLFNSALNASNNCDTLTDFQSGTDVLQMHMGVFPGLGSIVGGLAAGQFWSGAGVTAAHDADDHIIYNTTTGALYYDADGIGGVAAVQIAIVGTSVHPSLLSTDFEIIV